MAKKAHFPDEPTQKDINYAKRFLSPDEELELLTGYGSLYLRQMFLVGIIFPGIVLIAFPALYAYFRGLNIGYGLLAGLALASFFSLIKTLMLDRAHRYLLTSRRVIVKQGLFMDVKITSSLYDKITHIETEQTLIDRIFFRHGTVIINTAGGGDKDTLILRYVESPLEFKAILEGLVHAERRELLRESGTTVLTPLSDEE